jgi:pre-mRNA-processing factor SLU7
MTHKKKDCVERPRKRGAKFTGKDIMADEVLQDIQGDYDAKRDRWNGYDPASYKAVVEEYEATEAARREAREKEVDSRKFESKAVSKKASKDGTEIGADEDFGSSDEDDVDEDKYAESADQVGQKVDTKTRITVRNLRIREDTAKYLINLDIDSAHYDPKTRAMRDAPEEGVRREDVSGRLPRDLCRRMLMADALRRRQLCAILRRRDQYAEAPAVRLAIGSKRNQRQHLGEPDRGREA